MAVHIYKCPVRWSDLDVYGVVNNVSFLRLLEEARVDLIWRLGSANGDAFFDGGSVVVRHEIDYKRMLKYQASVDIHMWVSNVQAAAVTIECEVRDAEVIYAYASSTMAAFSYQEGRLRRLTANEQAFLEQFYEDRKAIQGVRHC
jgi:acyl-CoA thioester hydrolase